MNKNMNKRDKMYLWLFVTPLVVVTIAFLCIGGLMKKKTDIELIEEYKLARERVQVGLYKHSKTGELYYASGVVLAERNHEVLVKYISKKTGIEWCRPVNEFYEIMDIENGVGPRFMKVDEDQQF